LGEAERAVNPAPAKVGPLTQSLPNLGKGRAGRGDRLPGNYERGARRGRGTPACCPAGARSTPGVTLLEERLLPDSHRFAGGLPRRLASEERVATNDERLSERDETSPRSCPWLAGREESPAESSLRASGNREGGAKHDERLPKSGRSLSANDRSGSGQTPGTPRGDPWLNSHSERVSPCHLACAES
jgi:hypothetical protein